METADDKFGIAWGFTGPVEAGWQNNGDRGGETIFGVARNFHGDWKGWAMVDAAKSQPNFPASVNANPELKAMAAQFFREEFWNAICGDALPLPLAVAVFDQAVNFGQDRAIKEMQAVLDVTVDGVVGPGTVRAAAGATPAMVQRLMTNRLCRYMGDIDTHPEDRKWVYNWFSRVVDLTAFVSKLQQGGAA